MVAQVGPALTQFGAGLGGINLLKGIDAIGRMFCDWKFTQIEWWLRQTKPAQDTMVPLKPKEGLVD